MPMLDSIFSARYFSEKLKLNISSENVGRIGQTLFNSKIIFETFKIGPRSMGRHEEADSD